MLAVQIFTGLRDSYHILTLEHRWDTVSLDWSGHIITAELDIGQHHWMEASIFKLRQPVNADKLWKRLDQGTFSAGCTCLMLSNLTEMPVSLYLTSAAIQHSKANRFTCRTRSQSYWYVHRGIIAVLGQGILAQRHRNRQTIHISSH